MRCFLVPLWASVWFLTGVPAAAQTAADLVASRQVRLRARVEPARVLVGQKVTLSVDVMTRTWFLSAPAFPDVLDVEHAVVIPPGPFGVNSTQAVDGERYAVQTRTYSIFPTGVGAYRVPPFEVSLVVAREDASRSPDIVLTTPELRFEARVASAAEGLGLVVATPRLAVRQEWSRELDDLEVGDTVTRTLTSTIEDSAAMLLPGPRLVAPEGVSVYPGRPTLEDSRQRGEMSGRRVDRVVYVLEAEGRYDLPEIVIHWWDLEAQELRREHLPAVHLEVAANPDLTVESFGPQDAETGDDEAGTGSGEAGRRRLWLWLGAALVLLVIGWLVRRPLQGVGKAWAERRRLGAEEKTLFKSFKEAAHTGDARATIRSLMAWLDELQAEGGVASLEALVRSSADKVLEEQIAALERAVFSPRASANGWEASTLTARLARYRRAVLRRESQRQRLEAEELAPLNPRALQGARAEVRAGMKSNAPSV